MVHSGRRTKVTPLVYEEMVAAHFRQQGYSVELTPRSNDYGVDAFARRESQKLALQAKMYGGARKVNREMVMQLHGAKDYFDCTEAVIITDGEVTQNARQVAEKLRIKILSFPVGQPLPLPDLGPPIMAPKLAESCRTVPTFDEVWERYVMPLAGRTLVGPGGRTNTLLTVDWSGVKRLTSSERPQFIRIEVFRQAVGRLVERGRVTRDEINEDYAKRASSGVVLILSQVPFFEYLSGPSRLVLRKAS
ncbi:MAG: restriction endonuclease [Candidatus Sulfotelmatobacter sp.]